MRGRFSLPVLVLCLVLALIAISGGDLAARESRSQETVEATPESIETVEATSEEFGEGTTDPSAPAEATPEELDVAEPQPDAMAEPTSSEIDVGDPGPPDSEEVTPDDTQPAEAEESEPLQVAASAEPPPVGALAVAIVDAESGALLYGLNAHERRAQASLTKMTTALVAVANADLDTPIVGTERSLTEPVVIGFEPGDVLSLRDALYGLMLNSGNDAALAIAESVGDGSIDEFIDWMNLFVVARGLRDTHYVNPHGFDADGHYSSAYDVAMIGRILLRDRFLAQVVATPRHEVPGPPLWVFTTTNPLLGVEPGVDGIKTGYETNAGRCLAVSATRDGRQIISVVLHDDAWVEDSVALLNWAFARYEWRDVLVPRRTLNASVGGSTRTLIPATVVLSRGQQRYLRGMVRFEREHVWLASA